MISIAWAPNAQKDDLALAGKLLVQPWKWYGTNYVRKLEARFASYIRQGCVSFDSGRSALYAILKAYDIKLGDEIALQAFTCVALPNPILWTHATPIYVDVDKKNYNIDIEDLERKITSKTKAIIVQYTFGISPDIARIKEICEERDILLIEDCCHNLGQQITIKGETFKAGTIGDAAIFSFGMEKVISGTRGGMATSRNIQILDKLRLFQKNLKSPRFREILRGILNPITWKAKEKVAIVGSLFFKLMVKLKLHDYGLTKLELEGKKADWLPYKLPNPNAKMILNQLKKIETFNLHRKSVAAKYFENLDNLPDLEYANKYAQSIWLRVPMEFENPSKILKEAEKSGIVLGNWYSAVIHCKDVNMKAMKYIGGSCPNAEYLASHTINLPTHIGIGNKEIEKIINFLKTTMSS